MDDTKYDQEQAHYHFALAEIVYYISQYGVDSVMTDIYDYIAVQHKDKEQCELTLTS
jgi:hypothetical protein